MKITKDCYVNVLGWTDAEVLRAAEMFAKVGGGIVANIRVNFPDENYKYLMILEEDAFVGTAEDLLEHGCVKEMTKQDIFEEQQPSEWSGEGLPPVGTVCEFLKNPDEWLKGTIFGHRKNKNGVVDVFIDFESRSDWDYSSNLSRFRPIKSEKDKEIEELTVHIDDFENGFAISESLSEYLYNQGYRKTK